MATDHTPDQLIDLLARMYERDTGTLPGQPSVIWMTDGNEVTLVARDDDDPRCVVIEVLDRQLSLVPTSVEILNGESCLYIRGKGGQRAAITRYVAQPFTPSDFEA